MIKVHESQTLRTPNPGFQYNLQVGYIKTKNAWYMIEPVAGHDFTKEVEHPHIVYKKSPDEHQTAAAQDLCNVIGETSRNIAKRALNPQNRIPARSIENRSYTIELLVVLDKSLLDYHREFDVENYVLTLFNMVSRKSYKNFACLLLTLLSLGCRFISRR